MITNFKRATGLLFIAGVGVSSAWGQSVRLLPEQIQSGKPVWIMVKADPQVKVGFQVESNSDCGNVSPADATTNEQGEAKSVFTPTDPPAACEVSIKTTIAAAKDVAITDPGSKVVISKITVAPPAAEFVTLPTLDPTRAITIILVASFAIDRLVTLLMLFLPLGKAQGEQNVERLKKRQRLIYIALAGSLGLLLGYYGDIRLLAGLGFSTNTTLNAIVTALIFTAGSDSISALLKKMGGGGPEGEPKPLVVQGDLTLKRPERAHAASQASGGGSPEE
ncbi:MAG TPA: hypothetical protein VI636_09970 [Candidatus Angelobacter sp.]